MRRQIKAISADTEIAGSASLEHGARQPVLAGLDSNSLKTPPQAVGAPARPLSPTTLAQYIRFDNCERFLRFRLVPEDLERLLKRWGLTIQPLSPLLEESGVRFEQDIVQRLAGDGAQVIDLAQHGFNETLRLLRAAHLSEAWQPILLSQATLEAPIGRYACSGRADVIRLERDHQGRLRALIADIKATRTEKTEHRVQVAAYARMLQAIAAAHKLPLAELQGAVLIQRDDGGYPPLGPETPTFDLATYLMILDRLATAPGSAVERVANGRFEDAFYHLAPKCDGCLYNAVCMVDSAERLDLALTPQISAVEKRVLLEAGVRTLADLASLMELPASGESTLRPAEAYQSELAALNNHPPVGANLPLLTQRARSALHVFERSTDYRSFLYGAGFANPPDDERYPDLVKVFFDAQRDYLQDRLYLLAAYVRGPGGEAAIVKCADAPPTDDDEARLLTDWVQETLAAVTAIAGAPAGNTTGAAEQARLHLYCYSRYDQQALLAALKRWLTDVAALPAFYDLLTDSPALSQPMISFLSDEVQAQMNLGRACAPLHDVARWMGFNWKDERTGWDYFRLFQARMFDNRRSARREPDGRLTLLERDGAPRSGSGAPERIVIEAASRFSSQIPLEYAYAAWGRLPRDTKNPGLLAPFRRADLDILKGFAGRRVEALAHIEASFKHKSRQVEKPPLALRRLRAPDGEPDFALALREFIFIEHYTRLQGLLLHYAQSLEQRVHSGLTLLLRCRQWIGGERVVFDVQTAALGPDPQVMLHACKLKEGDFVALNLAEPPPSPNQMKHGRLAMIWAMGEGTVTLELTGITFPNSVFRYAHRRDLAPKPGSLFTIDPMADDLNADKLLEALDQRGDNVFFGWLEAMPRMGLLEERPPAVGESEFYAKFADYIAALLQNRKWELTPLQREVIAGRFTQPLTLVQGPPGTGKSYTLAWAVLAQIARAVSQGKPQRVLICCKTHNAVNVALLAVAQAQSQLGFVPPQLGGSLVFGAELHKVANDGDEGAPVGVNLLNPYTQRAGLEALLAKPALVIGATPGGLYNLMRYREPGERGVAWQSKTFDLVVIDEASQMSVPEGVLAGAFLRPEGRMLVVGDHRQMPPIVAHKWQDEQRRSAIMQQPYVSLFDALDARGCPAVRLDRSFRLHAEIAEFLGENIYAQDGIAFHSRRRDLIPQSPKTHPYVDAVMNPSYPIVVIEHGEAASQQFNPLELELSKPLIEACVRGLSLDGRSGIGVVVPHRAQKALLRAAFPDLAQVNAIDTVERFQGDERDVIIVSATASDPNYVRGEADFLLNLNRLNVAISRPRKKLIVIAARSVIDLMTSDLEVFEQSVIWKRLFHHYAARSLLEWKMDGYPVVVRGRRG